VSYVSEIVYSCILRKSAGKHGQFANVDLAVWRRSRREFYVTNNKSDGGDTIKDSTLAQHLSRVRESLERGLGSGFKLILFGSHARGEAGRDSDVDLMVILDDKDIDFRLKEKVRDMVYDLTLETDYLFSVIVVSENLVRERAGFQVFAAVEEEGIAI